MDDIMIIADEKVHIKTNMSCPTTAINLYLTRKICIITRWQPRNFFRNLYFLYLKASEHKWVNSNYILYGVNSLRLGGHQLMLTSNTHKRKINGKRKHFL